MIVLPMVQCQRMLRDDLDPSLSRSLSLTQQPSPLDQSMEVFAAMLDEHRRELRKALGLDA
jgi:hypothetical protein